MGAAVRDSGSPASLWPRVMLLIRRRYGAVKLSPNAPSSGAGIASRSAIPSVPGGDIDLIAPLGTIMQAKPA